MDTYQKMLAQPRGEAALYIIADGILHYVGTKSREVPRVVVPSTLSY